MIYLDNSATTRQHDQVTDTMLTYMREDFGNPSSLYSLGITAEKAVKEARKKVMKAMGRKAFILPPAERKRTVWRSSEPRWRESAGAAGL